MNLPDNIFFEVPTLPGAGFILNTISAHYNVAKIYKFKTMEELERFYDANFISRELRRAMQVPGYSIIIAPVGSLERIDLPFKDGMSIDILVSMVNFYKNEYISNKKPAFKRYEIEG